MEHSVGLRVVELFESCKSDVEGFQLLLVGKQNVYALAQCYKQGYKLREYFFDI